MAGYNRKDVNDRKTQLQGKRMSKGWIALLTVAGSDLLGIIYFRYLQTNPFPPDAVRLIPAIWLAGTLLGGVLAARALRSDTNRVPPAVALILDIPSAVLALVFAFAALMGD